MPGGGGGGSSNISGANITDGSLSEADFAATAVPYFLPSAKVMVPRPVAMTEFSQAIVTLTGNTTLNLGLVHVPFKQTIKKISFVVGTNNVAGTYKLAMFSEDGQTRLFNVTTATISAGNQIIITAVADVPITAGNYWIALLPVGTASHDFNIYNNPTGNNADDLDTDVTSEPATVGTLTVTADTMPSTITPGDITGGVNKCIVFRLDD